MTALAWDAVAETAGRHPPRAPEREAHRWGMVTAALAVAAFAATPVVGMRPALTALGLAGFAGALCGIARPVLGLYAVTLLCALDAMLRVNLFASGGLLRWNTLNYLLVGVAALGLPTLLRLPSAPLRLLQAFAAVLALGLVISADRARGVQDLLAAVAVFGLVVYAARASQFPGVWHWLGYGAGAAGAAAGLAFHGLGAPVHHIDANAWALSALVPLVAVTYAILEAHRVGRALGALPVLAALNAASVFLSGSRGTTLVAAACLLFAALTAPSAGRRALLVAALVLAAAGVAAGFQTERARAAQRLTALVDGDRSFANRTSHRWSLVVGGWYLFRSQPLTGVGTGAFVPAWRRVIASDPEIARRVPDFRAVAAGRDAHAGWVKVAAENGVAGLATLAAVVAAFVAAGRRAGRAAAGGLAAVVIAGLLISTEYRSKSPWFAAACAVAVMHGDRIRALAAPSGVALRPPPRAPRRAP
jgi:hypothetical protein